MSRSWAAPLSRSSRQRRVRSSRCAHRARCAGPAQAGRSWTTLSTSVELAGIELCIWRPAAIPRSYPHNRCIGAWASPCADPSARIARTGTASSCRCGLHSVLPTTPLWRIVSLLGIAQIISWGSLYYTLTVLAAPIRQELGFNDLIIFGAFTLGQLLSGVAAPRVGRQVDKAGGRNVMMLGSFTAALALVVVAAAREPILFTLGWILVGLAMTACLYEPAFASLYQIAPDRYRRSVTGLTLFGGFASTVFWPLSHALAEAYGWRATLLIFAALHLLICVPIHRLALPARLAGNVAKKSAAPGSGSYM